MTDREIHIKAYDWAKYGLPYRKREKFQIRYPSYKGATVCAEWIEFIAGTQRAYEWYIENYWEAGNELMVVDKDILTKGNKHYSPETCIIVPEKINKLFRDTKRTRGKYPKGVSFDTNGAKNTGRTKLWIAQLRLNDTVKNLGRVGTMEEAFGLVKVATESKIRGIADEYMAKYPDTMPKRLYDAMYAYRVEITD